MMQTLLKDNTLKLRDDLDITVIDHDARLQATAVDIKQEIKTALFLDLKTWKERLKAELIEEINLLKND